MPKHGRSMLWSLMKEDGRDHLLRRIFFFRTSSLRPRFLRIVSLQAVSHIGANCFSSFFFFLFFLLDPSRHHKYMTLATTAMTTTASMFSSVFCTLRKSLAVEQGRKIKCVTFAGGSKQEAKYIVLSNWRQVCAAHWNKDGALALQTANARQLHLQQKML